ncbi:MAG: LysR family transcriptional regulator [Capsulimonadaceae bacterium]|nr:LysR family transcriptional regulator [Capsulimonadaceae bacterium]
MELRNLETFVRIASLGSFTKAAEELAITQPAATRQVAALERELRTRLLDRLGRRVVLTETGRALYRHASDMLRIAGEAARTIAEISSGTSGRIGIGASSTVVTYLLAPLLRSYREAHPGVDVSVRTGASRRVAEMVIENDVDLGIVMESPIDDALTVVALAEYANVVVVAPGNPLAALSGVRAIAVEEIAGAELVLMQPGTTMRTMADRILAGVNVGVSMELDNVEAIKKMVEARLGISILPLVAVRDEVRAGTLIALEIADVAVATQCIAAIHRRDKYLTASIRDLVALLQAELGGGDGWGDRP